MAETTDCPTCGQLGCFSLERPVLDVVLTLLRSLDSQGVGE